MPVILPATSVSFLAVQWVRARLRRSPWFLHFRLSPDRQWDSRDGLTRLTKNGKHFTRLNLRKIKQSNFAAAVVEGNCVADIIIRIWFTIFQSLCWQYQQTPVRVTGQCYGLRLYGLKDVTLFRCVCPFWRNSTKTSRVPDITRYARLRVTHAWTRP